MTRLFCILSALALSACASQTRLSEPVRTAANAKHSGRTVELRQSCFYGDLYDENEKYLLSPHAFAETYHIVDLDGVPIHPQGERGVVPAGTRFVVQKVEFPDARAMAKRMLTTPRYNPWIYLTPAEASTDLPTDRGAYILLLPMDLKNAGEVDKAISAALGDDGVVSKWVAGLRPTVQVAIKYKRIIEQMTEEELFAAMGTPNKWYIDRHEEKKARVAWYGAHEAWLVDGVVVAVKDGRQVEPKPAKAAPAETPPAETAPAETAPAETTPAEAGPTEATPAETTPAETAP